MSEIPEGFIAHDGGPCPVAPNSFVDVIFRDGEIATSEGCWEASWWSDGKDWWRHEGDPECNIIAYRQPEGE